MASGSDNSLLEKAAGGLPLVQYQGLNTNKSVNFSGTQIDTSGNITVAAGATTTLGSTVTGPTGSFNVVNVQQAGILASTGGAALLGTAGASGGGPTTAQMTGWTVIYVAGVKSWVPYWR